MPMFRQTRLSWAGRSLPFLATAACILVLSGCQVEEAERDEISIRNEATLSADATTLVKDAEPASGDGMAATPKAAQPPLAASWSPSGYALNGTEPFWGGTLTGTNLVYTTPENHAGDAVSTSAVMEIVREVCSGSLGRQAVIGTLTNGACSDGMSEHEFTYMAVMQVAGETRKGCADSQ